MFSYSFFFLLHFVNILLFFIAPVQFEEIDNMKSSLNLTNSSNLPSSITPDLLGGPSDELITFDPPATGSSTFQAHFPVSSPTMSSGWPSTTNMKKSDSNRGKIFYSLLLIQSIKFSSSSSL